MLGLRARGLARRPIHLIIAVGLATWAGGLTPAAGAQSTRATTAAPPDQKRAPAKPAPGSEEEEDQALENAFTSAVGKPQDLIKNLQDFLARFPQSPRRERILRTILREAYQSNDPRAAIAAAVKLLELNPDDAGQLSTLVELLDRQKDAASLQQAIRYATRLVELSAKTNGESKPLEVSAEKWQESRALKRARAHLLRGKAYADAGEIEKASADYEACFAAYPDAQIAERLGDLASKAGKIDRAIDYYATAFAFPGQGLDAPRREEIRRKLGSYYVAKYHSEKGLGDLVLARYDELMPRLRSRLKTQDAAHASITDPFDYVLERPDGPALRLADYRGKVVVMDFWATWCVPCRVEGRLLEQVIWTFRNDPRVAFLAVNLDEERDGVPSFIQTEGWTIPVAYGQGLELLLGVRALPTLIIFDPKGRVTFRREGVDPSRFTGIVESAVRAALGL